MCLRSLGAVYVAAIHHNGAQAGLRSGRKRHGRWSDNHEYEHASEIVAHSMLMLGSAQVELTLLASSLWRPYL